MKIICINCFNFEIGDNNENPSNRFYCYIKTAKEITNPCKQFCSDFKTYNKR